jgi:hypothetical protein
LDGPLAERTVRGYLKMLALAVRPADEVAPGVLFGCRHAELWARMARLSYPKTRSNY